MTRSHPTALIADDEPLLREAMTSQLGGTWPELTVVAQARNGREAIELFEARKPDICFLDVHMPGLSGIDAARHIGRRAHLVFVTAYDHYAVEAFAHGVLDYLVKPVHPLRLQETVTRLKERLDASKSAPNTDALLHELAAKLQRPPERLRWIRAQVGDEVQLIADDEIDYLRSDAKYTLVAWGAKSGRPAEALVRTPLKALLANLDPERFVQVHRSVVVNLDAINHVKRRGSETAEIRLKSRKEVLPVSRTFLHLFRQM